MTTHTIIHLDLDAFFCAIEELHNPALSTRPFAVGAPPQSRGVVASCSYSARKLGVRSAMPMSRALRLCPGLIIVPPRHALYEKVSQQIMNFLHTISPHLEQISIDEAFLDVSELLANQSMPIEPMVRDLQSQINQKFCLPVSIGVASNKLVAKIANDVGKSAHRGDHPPNAITIVPDGKEAEFLAPLPVQMLWGVGPKTASRLSEMGISTIGDLAAHPEIDLVRIFGVLGIELSRHAKGIDTSPLITSHVVKSISQETTFAQDILDLQVLIQTIERLSEIVSQRLIEANLAGATIKVKIRYHDFTTITRQLSFEIPVNQSHQISKVACELFTRHWVSTRAVRLLGVGVSSLVNIDQQLSLWSIEPDSSPNPQPADRQRKIEAVIEEIRGLYGDRALRKGFPNENGK